MRFINHEFETLADDDANSRLLVWFIRFRAHG